MWISVNRIKVQKRKKKGKSKRVNPFLTHIYSLRLVEAVSRTQLLKGWVLTSNGVL